MTKLGRIVAVLLVGLLFVPSIAWAVAEPKRDKKPKRRPPRDERVERKRSDRGVDLERFTETLPPRVRGAIHRLWEAMPPPVRERVHERLQGMSPEQRRELMERVQRRATAGDRRGGPAGRGPGAGPDGGRFRQALTERFHQLPEEQQRRVHEAMQRMSPERRREVLERVHRFAGGPREGREGMGRRFSDRGPGRGPDRSGPDARRPGPGGPQGRHSDMGRPGPGGPHGRPEAGRSGPGGPHGRPEAGRPGPGGPHGRPEAGRPGPGGPQGRHPEMGRSGPGGPHGRPEAGRPGPGRDSAGDPRVREERVRNVVRETLNRLPEEARRQLRDALGHLPPDRRGRVLEEALGGGGPQAGGPPHRPDAAPRRPDRPAPNARPGDGRKAPPDRAPKAKKGKDGAKAKDGKRDGRKEKKDGPKAKDGRKADGKAKNAKPDGKKKDGKDRIKDGKTNEKGAERKDKKGGKKGSNLRKERASTPTRLEQMIRSGIARLPEPARTQIGDRLGRVLPRLREQQGWSVEEVRNRFREALHREFEALSPEQRGRVIDWYGTVGD